MELIKSLDAEEAKPNLVFTSAGDNSVLEQWIGDDMNFDLFVCRYGENKSYEKAANYYIERKGGKFPNLLHAYQAHPEIFDRYESIFVVDDDIDIQVAGINQLFQMREEYNLWLLQPSFFRRGKVSFIETLTNPTAKLRYTNFIENNCPVFRADKLKDYLGVYEPTLVGWGTDIWYSKLLLGDREDKCAIADAVVCTNPRDDVKQGGLREIDKLQKTEDRQKVWQEIANRHGLPVKVEKIKIYKTIYKPFLGLNTWKGLVDLAFFAKYYFIHYVIKGYWRKK